jgi:hypothetical protein
VSPITGTTAFTDPSPGGHLSYFVGTDADETKPSKILSGDRNIIQANGVIGGGTMQFTSDTMALGATWDGSIHVKAGNLGLSDGSVMQATIDQTGKQVRAAGNDPGPLSATLPVEFRRPSYP